MNRNVLDYTRRNFAVPKRRPDTTAVTIKADKDATIFAGTFFHLFLPKRTPSIQQPELEDTELYILKSFSNSINAALDQVSLPNLHPTKQMLEMWGEVQPKSGDLHPAEAFSARVAALEDGHTLPIYVRKQNATLLITRRLGETEVATFRCSLPSKIVMSTVDSHSLVFPETQETVERSDMLSSITFATQLQDLTLGDINITLGKTKKGDQEYNETRDVADPRLVTDWIIGLLVPKSQESSIKRTFPPIRKKLRDQVTFSMRASNSLPFRRSGMLMALKVALQLKVTENLENNVELGKYVYKLLILRILTDYAEKFAKQQTVNLDFGCQILAKLGKRVHKLSQLHPKTTLAAIMELKDHCLNHALSIILGLKAKMDKLWSVITKNSEKCNQGFIRNKGSSAQKLQRDKSKDLLNEIPKLDEFIEFLNKSKTENVPSNNPGNGPLPVSRYLTMDSIKASGSRYISGSDVRIWLFDTENYIKFASVPHDTASEIHEILSKYNSLASKTYVNDPLGMSQLALVNLKGLELLDRRATSQHPELLNYRIEINTSAFENILLPYVMDIRLLDSLMDYFLRRARNGSNPQSYILGRKVDSYSFSVQYAKTSEAMRALRAKILAETDTKILEKYSEVERCKIRCGELQQMINLENCSCEWKVTGRGRWIKRKKIRTCDRCNRISRLENVRKSVERYERPLPAQETFQWAVVFELLIPEDYAVWRDFLGFFKYEILGDTIFEGQGNSRLPVAWKDYGRFKYEQPTRSSGNTILGSCSQPASNTYVTRTQNLDVLINSPESFIINNGMGCNFYYKPVFSTPIENMAKVCSFQLQNTEGYMPYENLQDTICSTTHNQNSIIARQHSCHEKLSLREFVAFGSLRAGARIQLRNLYEAIYSGDISLHEESVLALILETIWQVGPHNANKKREAHLDFLEPHFAEQFVEMLDELVKRNAANYSSAQTVLAAVIIITRIRELSQESLRNKIHLILQNWRKIIDNWIEKIEKELDIVTQGKLSGSVSSLQKNLQQVFLCSLLSYSVSDSTHLTEIMKTEEDIVHWLHTIYRLHNDLNDETLSLSDFSKTLRHFARLLPLRISLEDQIVRANESVFLNSLNTFICRIWSKGEHAVMEGVKYSSSTEKCNVLSMKYKEAKEENRKHYLTFDFAQGTLLVNGNPESELSYKIKEDKLFKLYFKSGSKLRVRRENESITSTVSKYRGRQYEFQEIKVSCQGTRQSYRSSYSTKLRLQRGIHFLDDDDDDMYYALSYNSYSKSKVIIKEKQDDGSAYVLLDPDYFSNILSSYFITNHSHWIDTSKNRILIRPESITDVDNVPPESFILERVKVGERYFWKLYDVRTREYFLGISSEGFQAIRSSLARLELSQYINVTQNSKKERTAHLRRHNLRFRLNDNGQHECVEYPGFSISNNQNGKGTLIGLRHGLLIESRTKRSVLLIPHASIEINRKSGQSHQTVTIDLEHLRQPSCFAYEYDEVLKRLKAHNNKTAWLYLATLHAATSSPLPDPFTRVTGTEMCIGILQLPCVLSCSPYDQESLSSLKFIQGLAPKRKYYGRPSKGKNRQEEEGSMEVVEWPEALSSLAAYDGFSIVVQKMIRDCERLAVLFPDSTPKKEKEHSNNEYSDKLVIRAYKRYLSFYNSLVSLRSHRDFISSHYALLTEDSSKVHQLTLRQSSEKMHLSNLLLVSTARFTNHAFPFQKAGSLRKNNLHTFLLEAKPLGAQTLGFCLKDAGSFTDVLQLNFRYDWLRLYQMAISCTSEDEVNAFTLLLCTAAYRGAPMEQVSNLHCISQHAHYGITFPQVSELSTQPESEPRIVDINRLRLEQFYGSRISEYSNPTLSDYENEKVVQILKSHPMPFTEMEKPTRPSYSYSIRYSLSSESHTDYVKRLEEYEQKMKEYQTKEAAYLTKVQASCSDLSRQIRQMIWPSEKIENPEVEKLLESFQIKSWKAIAEINELLKVWYKNYKLLLFVQCVQSNLNLIMDKIQFSSAQVDNPGVPSLPECYTCVNTEKLNLKPIQLEDLLQVELGRMYLESRQIYEQGKIQDIMELANLKERSSKYFLKKRQEVQRKINEITSDLMDMVNGSIFHKIINLTPVAPRIDPRSTLKYLCYTQETEPKRKVIADYGGALGVLRTYIMKLNRCIRATAPTEIDREIGNPGHENWSPAEYPEWLLLELELNIMIRPVQVEVAKQMMCMPNGGKNGVTQLNMGEGKTSVIVPMLCATLAKQDEQLCRVTVLSSMFNMNLNSLTFAIGGLLNRRVYWLPCRRDLPIDLDCATTMAEVYEECLNSQGVVLTLPEHRLSFRLLAYDKLLKTESTLGMKMLSIENWSRKFCRDILDESDELLSVKYQLVYTVGEHQPIDGGDLRWTACQLILNVVQELGDNFLQKHGSSVWEMEKDPKLPHEFSYIRLLDIKYLDEFLDLVADKVLEEVQISEGEMEFAKKFLLKSENSKDEHEMVTREIFRESPNDLLKILVYSGYLKRGVLGLALTKRWRVEYGVDIKKGFRRMAVPFRAKDVAAEKTEFGHPDLAIVLTHLSYYYSGLSEAQMKETLEVLKGKQVPEAIYSSWIAAIPVTPSHLQEYKNLNMRDASQMNELFELLRKHRAVVNFWLANCVFPRESKQFPGKLVMTAWDLCYERQQFPVTGFSGTDDSQVLLPLMIQQHNLPVLLKTNEKMEKTLLQPENKGHKGLRMGVTCREILEQMKKDNLAVLIDAGALMLELNNEQIADLWLQVNEGFEAVVYFSQDNNLMVKSRSDHGQGTAFDVSPYQGRLEKCGAFLDDVHTRGTDIKFPEGSRACVTIGARMKRDKMIQACMRMRKLGQGHSVTFYLSHEAHAKVGELNGNREVTTQNVLHWVQRNTAEFNENGLLYWALAGRNYAQRLAAEDNFHFPKHESPWEVEMKEEKTAILANQCVDDEVIKLDEMYGQYTQIELLTSLVPKWFAYAMQKLKDKHGGRDLSVKSVERFDEIRDAVRERCQENVPDKTHVTSGMMEEEQEKELELEKETEVEEQRQVERPRKADTVDPSLHSYVKEVVFSGEPIQMCRGGIVRVGDVFMGTSFRNKVQPDCWNHRVFATTDFVSVVRGNLGYCHTDDHLRPIQYVASFASGQLLLLSPFEVNELMPYFRGGGTKCTLHMFSLRKSEKQDLLLNIPRLQLPVSVKGVKIEESSGPLASLLLASGSLYFKSKEEQAGYLGLLCLALQPWSREEKLANQKKLITKNGFLLPEGRKTSQLGFQSDPTELIKKILDCRHPVVSELTHVIRILEKRKKIEFAEHFSSEKN